MLFSLSTCWQIVLSKKSINSLLQPDQSSISNAATHTRAHESFNALTLSVINWWLRDSYFDATQTHLCMPYAGALNNRIKLIIPATSIDSPLTLLWPNEIGLSKLCEWFFFQFIFILQMRGFPRTRRLRISSTGAEHRALKLKLILARIKWALWEYRFNFAKARRSFVQKMVRKVLKMTFSYRVIKTEVKFM